MDTTYEGKTAAQWIGLLQSADVPKQCAAALALAELTPTKSPVKDALLAAVADREIPVQVAAQIAIGFLQVPRENRRKMFEHLLGPDDEMRRSILYSLEDLAGSPLRGAALGKDEEHVPPVELAPGNPAEPKLTASQASAPPIAMEEPDIAIVYVFPWWFLLGGITLCIGIAWLLRGIWWPKWTLAVAAAVAGLWFAYLCFRRKEGRLSRHRYHARARLAWSAICACMTGFFVGLFFPAGAIYVDNESGVNVRLFLDGSEWVSIPSGESKKLSLPRGTYHLSIQAVEKNHVFDAHDIEVAAYEKYVLNVLGGQVYFHGKMQYGGARGVDMKVVQDKWFPVPEVDYLFRDPPQEIVSAHPITKTFFTKGMPPRLRGVE
jgi:hypothetical protein